MRAITKNEGCRVTQGDAGRKFFAFKSEVTSEGSSEPACDRQALTRLNVGTSGEKREEVTPV